MKRAALIPLLTLALALPLSAQHGGGHAGGGGFHGGGGSFHGGGFASHASAPSHSSFGSRPAGSARFAPGRPSSPAIGAPSGYRRLAPGAYGSTMSRSRPAYGANGLSRPGYPGREHHNPYRPEYNRGGYGASVLPYGYDPYLSGYGDLGFPYDNNYDDSYNDPGDQGYADPGYSGSEAYPAGPDAYSPGQSAPDQAAPGQYGPDRSGPGPEASQQPLPYNYGYRQPAPHPAAAPRPEEAVTIVFNNGAPSQQIHNYILSRNTLTVLDGPRREIPVAQLDLAATARANRAAGVDFHLPQ